MKIIKNKYFIIGAVLFFLLVIFAFVFGRKPKIEYTTAIVVKGDIIQTVSETGTVKAANEVNLNFPGSGKIANIYVKLGDKVKKDQVLAELDNSDLTLRAREAEANLQVSRANLAKLLAGATAAELAVSQASVNQAKTASDSALIELEKTKNTVQESVKQAEKNYNDLFITTGDSLTNYQYNLKNYQASALTVGKAKIISAKTGLDNINTILNDSDAKNNLGVTNSSALQITKDGYTSALSLISPSQASLSRAELSQDSEDINRALSEIIKLLDSTFSALEKCYSLLEASVSSGNFSQADLDAYKTTISTQQTTISTAQSAAQTAQNNLNNSINDLNNAILAAKNALATAKVTGDQQIAAAQSKADSAYRAWQVALAQYNELRTGARSQDISLSQAQVNQAQAALDLINNQISNNSIKSPAEGTITKINYEAGEQALGSTPVFSLLSINNFEIEVDVSEADINKISLDDEVAITLDAYGEDEKFSGRVSFIEPAETIIQDVIYYKVKINFDGRDKIVKSGMTANVIITTAWRDDVLIMPSRAVIEKNGNGKIARLLINQELKEVPITIGLRGDDGLVEVLAGLKEGDAVVTYIKQSE